MEKKHNTNELKKSSQIQTREITEEMKESYLSYAMSVIVSRALPDVRDGLKPVQRRILYAMYEMGLHHAAKTVKSARVVGEVMGKYHPHGDAAIYDALVRMAQPFSLRYPLIHGQGNFGSIDNDPPAAERYTEAKMSMYAGEMLADIDKQTVDFQPNYDNTRQEPKVLPAKLPNLLLNGSMGIAVGMATNIPPHNASEVIAALRFLLRHKNATTRDLLRFIKGPDFPTAGIIYNQEDILSVYGTGRGSIVMRGRAEIVNRQTKKEEFDIVITEIPYEVNKAALVSKIASLVEAKKIEGIKDIRDESDKEGLRIVIELKSSSQPKRVLNQLFHYTDLEKKFHFNMLALVDGIQPKTLSLKEILEEFIEYRKSTVLRRTRYELQKTSERIHILEGLTKALDHLEAVIKTIRLAASREKAKIELMTKFKFSDRQAEAILLMRLEYLAKMERQKIYDELKEKHKLAKELQEILDSSQKLIDVIDKEFLEMQSRYGDGRKTEIFSGKIKELKEEELIAQKQVIVTLSQIDYVKRLDIGVFRVQHRGGKGVVGFETKGDGDGLRRIVTCNTHDTLFWFTNTGKVFFLKAYEVPESNRTSRGKPASNFINISSGEKIATYIAYPNSQAQEKYVYLVLATKNGIIKKVKLEELLASRSGIRIINLKKDDELIRAGFSSGKDDILLISRRGQAIRFSETQVRSQGRTGQGIKAIELRSGDVLVGMDVVSREKDKEAKMLVMTEKGFGKMTFLNEYRLQKRGGMGIKTIQLSEKTGELVNALVVTGEQELIAVSLSGQTIRINLASIPIQGRITQGVRIMKLDENDRVTSITVT